MTLSVKSNDTDMRVPTSDDPINVSHPSRTRGVRPREDYRAVRRPTVRPIFLPDTEFVECRFGAYWGNAPKAATKHPWSARSIGLARATWVVVGTRSNRGLGKQQVCQLITIGVNFSPVLANKVHFPSSSKGTELPAGCPPRRISTYLGKILFDFLPVTTHLFHFIVLKFVMVLQTPLEILPQPFCQPGR